MGVTGLHKLLQPFAEIKHVSEFAGSRLGVDGYAWLHRAAASCADDLFNRRETCRLVQSIDNRIRLFERHNVELFFVFDGVPLGMKSAIEQQRREKRQQAAKLSKTAKHTSSYSSLAGLDITADHAAMVIALLKQRKIRYVVAPFEADSQMVWLESHGLVDGIISEDSDLLVFGAQKLLTKSDANNGTFVELNSAKFPFHFRDLSHLRALAILVGCDYCSGIHGLGPIKATAMVQRMRGDLNAILQSLICDMRADESFLATARKADLAFQYQQVWDVEQKQITHLNELPSDRDKDWNQQLTEEVVGRNLSRPEAHRIAVGAIDPHDFSRELMVGPLVSQFVNRCRPFVSKPVAKQTTKQTIIKHIDRRLSSITTSDEGVSSNIKSKSPFSRNFSIVDSKVPGMLSQHWSRPVSTETKADKVQVEEDNFDKKIGFGPKIVKIAIEESDIVEESKLVEETNPRGKYKSTEKTQTVGETEVAQEITIEAKPTKVTPKIRSPFFAQWCQSPRPNTLKARRESTEVDVSFSNMDREKTVADFEFTTPSLTSSSNQSCSSLSSISSSPPRPSISSVSLTPAAEPRPKKRQNSFQLARRLKTPTEEPEFGDHAYVSESSDLEDATTPADRLALLSRFKYVPK